MMYFLFSPSSIVSCSLMYFLFFSSSVSCSRYKSQPVAIKVIQPEKAVNVSPPRKGKFEREVMLLARMQHENVVKVHVLIVQDMC